MRTGADIEQDQFRVLIPQQTGFCISRQPQRIRSPTWVLIECKSLSNHSCPAETLTIRTSC